MNQIKAIKYWAISLRDDSVICGASTMNRAENMCNYRGCAKCVFNDQIGGNLVREHVDHVLNSLEKLKI